MKTAYFDCFAGISGDMALAALVDAGADFEELKTRLDLLGIREFDIECSTAAKRGICATDVRVVPGHHHHGHDEHHHGRSYSEIVQLINASGLSERVKQQSVAIFTRLGEAEARIHGKSIDEIHFHEVGAVDAIVDIVGVCVCLELLGIDKVYSSPMPTFHGSVDCAHGRLPLPAPATMELLKGVPWRDLGIEGELVTPTGAAIVSTLAEGFGPMPAMSVDSIGHGAGKNDYGIPNVLRVFVGQREQAADEQTDVWVVETNIDDMNPQLYDAVMERLFAAGALDVYLAPIHMKKNRPATLLCAICGPADVDRMTEVIFDETTSIGVRMSRASRACLCRETAEVDTDYGRIRVKVARRAGKVSNAQPEYEDCKAAAAKHSVPVKTVQDAATAAFINLHSSIDTAGPQA